MLWRRDLGNCQLKQGNTVAIEFDPLFERAMEDLPADRELAFAVYVQRTEEILDLEGDRLVYLKSRLLKRSAVNHIVGLMQALDISLPIPVVPPGGHEIR